jgi:hypothetical protein
MHVWLFNGEGSHFASGVFSALGPAEEWIAKHSLSGILTAYPVDEGVFDWAIARGLFKPKPGKNLDARFIGRFTSAAQEHYHYVDGRRS